MDMRKVRVFPEDKLLAFQSPANNEVESPPLLERCRRSTIRRETQHSIASTYKPPPPWQVKIIIFIIAIVAFLVWVRPKRDRLPYFLSYYFFFFTLFSFGLFIASFLFLLFRSVLCFLFFFLFPLSLFFLLFSFSYFLFLLKVFFLNERKIGLLFTRIWEISIFEWTKSTHLK